MSDNEIEYNYENEGEIEEQEEEEEEEVEYEYSDNDNDDDIHNNNNDNDDIIESQTIFNIPDSSYKILDYKEVLPLMEIYIQEVSNLLSIPHDTSHILLKYYKWNKEKLIDLYYNNTEQILIDAGVSKSNSSSSALLPSSSSSSTSSSSSSISKSPSLPNSTIKCRICADNFILNQVYGLDCGHKFCKDCYGTYLIHQINDGPSCVFAHCPEYQCKQSITMGTVSTLCSSEMNEKYLMYLTRNFIETSTYMRWCPSPGCERVAIGSGVTTVRCLCSFPFCFRCGQEAHDPSTCSQLASWQEKCNNESETANWILANTKKCPKCQTRIEKNQGCNHMNCKMCKHEFCWICMGSWSDHGQNTGGYYKCNKYVPNTEDSTVEKAKAELDRYLHYYQRYHGHDSALSFAAIQRANAERKMMELQESEKSAWVDVQFLKQAVEQVIECRRVLKYTYVLGHYLKDGTAQKELYEHHQEMLEKHTERLSELTEIKTTFTENDRAHVVNLTRVTEKFMNSMLNTAMDDTDHVLNQLSSGGKESTP